MMNKQTQTKDREFTTKLSHTEDRKRVVEESPFHSCSMQVSPVRIPPDQDISKFLLGHVRMYNLRAAFIVTCVGSVKSVNLRFATDEDGQHMISEVKDNMEICSLVGTVSIDGCHLHGTFGNSKGQTISGHVMGNMIVQTTAEIVIGYAVGLEFRRIFDPKTGFRELEVRSESDEDPKN